MRILIFSVKTGGGHMRAAQALQKYIVNTSNNNYVEVVDTLECISPLLNKTITECYEQIVKKTPKLFGSICKSTNTKKKLGAILPAFLSFISKWIVPVVEDFKPDIIISTHPFSAGIISDLREVNKINTPHMCILTDYAPHLTWIHKNVDSYIVANSNMIPVMEKMGVPTEKIHAFGIPVDGAFYSNYNKDDILTQLNFKHNIPTILIMAGSFGVNDILKLYKNIVTIDMEFQIIVITGTNHKLYKDFEKRLSYKPRRKKLKSKQKAKPKKLPRKRKFKLAKTRFVSQKPTELIYFTNEVEKYMKVSDLIITKPGGLTVSEALACNLPMAIFSVMPGPEKDNADFLMKNNMAVKISKGKACKEIITQLLKDEHTLQELKASCEAFDKSHSHENIFMEIERLVNEQHDRDKQLKNLF